MTSQETVIETVLERLTKLERQNRRLKRTGVAALIVAASLAFMGQASKPKTIEANEFILRDASGNTRAKLWVDGAKAGEPMGIPGRTFRADPTLALYDEQGNPSVFLRGNDGGTVSAATLGVRDSGHTVGMLTGVTGSGLLTLYNSKQTVKAEFVSDRLSVTDDQGFTAAVGTSDLVTPRTGETHRTSAASLILLDKNKNVIWQAP
jgi:hypothetical protein